MGLGMLSLGMGLEALVPGLEQDARNKEALSTGALARAAETTERTIRYYEAEGLLQAERSPGGHRIFPPGALVRVQLIKDLRLLHFSVDAIRALLRSLEDAQGPGRGTEAPPHADADAELPRRALIDAAEELETKLQSTQAQLASIRRVQSELLNALQTMHHCAPCDEPPGGPRCPSCDHYLDRGPSRLLDVLYQIGSPKR